ncbi:hypothetical protein DPMN_050294 [Dreissena polymorpha]|uniref:Uncharacterized protein n=1 Tax=Dreissena polymorpha TaxID=45954 RepID=A0A9D4CHQ4_DREPO|nr:hypothetical protein DPMN_050294 [Dreissena polymorpha]
MDTTLHPESGISARKFDYWKPKMYPYQCPHPIQLHSLQEQRCEEKQQEQE